MIAKCLRSQLDTAAQRISREKSFDHCLSSLWWYSRVHWPKAQATNAQGRRVLLLMFMCERRKRRALLCCDLTQSCHINGIVTHGTPHHKILRKFFSFQNHVYTCCKYFIKIILSSLKCLSEVHVPWVLQYSPHRCCWDQVSSMHLPPVGRGSWNQGDAPSVSLVPLGTF